MIMVKHRGHTSKRFPNILSTKALHSKKCWLEMYNNWITCAKNSWIIYVQQFFSTALYCVITAWIQITVVNILFKFWLYNQNVAVTWNIIILNLLNTKRANKVCISIFLFFTMFSKFAEDWCTCHAQIYKSYLHGNH